MLHKMYNLLKAVKNLSWFWLDYGEPNFMSESDHLHEGLYLPTDESCEQ